MLAAPLFMCASFSFVQLETTAADEIKYPGIIAKIGDEIITSSDLEKNIALTVLITGCEYSPDVRQQILRNTLEQMITDSLRWKIVQKFSPAGGWVSDEEINAQIAAIAEGNNLSVKQFYEFLQTRKVDKDALRSHVKINIAWRKYIEARYGKESISEFEIGCLERKIADSKGKPLYEIRRAFFSIDKAKDEAQVMAIVRNKADILNRGADFSRVVEQINVKSEVVPENLLSPNVKQALEKSAVGKYCIVKENNGVWLVLLKDKYLNQGTYTKLRVIQVAIPDKEENQSQEDCDTQMRFAQEIRSSSKNINELIENARISGLCAISDVNEVALEQFEYDVRQALSSTPAGRVTPPVRTRGAVSLFCVLSRESHKIPTPTLQEVIDMERNKILNKRSEAELQNERKKCNIKVYGKLAR